jgi:hypothetical protein
VAALIKAQQADPGDFFLDRIHLIGHSRGCVVASEMIERLAALTSTGEDQRLFPGHKIGDRLEVTWLDPNTTGYLIYDFSDDDINLPDISRGVVVWNNVDFTQNYFQNRNFLGLDVVGEFVPSSRNRNFDKTADVLSHSEVHAWYYGTIDLEATDDTLASMIAEESLNTLVATSARPLSAAELEQAREDITANIAISRGGWYLDGSGVTEGYAHLPRGGGIPFNPTVEPLDTTPTEPPRFNLLKDSPFNGDFAIWGSGTSTLGPGWERQGGGGGGQVESGALRLFGNSTTPVASLTRVHNRSLIPSAGEMLAFDWKVVVADPGTPPNVDHLVVRIGDQVVLGGPGHELWLNQTTSQFNEIRAAVPAQFHTDPVQTLAFEILGGGGAYNSEVRIDNVRFTGDPIPAGVETFDQTDFGVGSLGEGFVHDLMNNHGTAANVDSVLFTGLTGSALADYVVGSASVPEPDGGLMPAQTQDDMLEAQTLAAYFNTLVPSSFVTPLNFNWVLNADPVFDLSGGSVIVRTPPANPKLAALAAADTSVLDVVLLGATALQITGGNEQPTMSGSLNGVPLTVQDLIDLLDIINESFDGGVPTGAVIPP